MRLAYYAGASTAAAAACLLKAFHQRPNFYSATVYLSQSNACLLILTNLLLVFACTFMYGLQRVLYGPLRPIEVEQLSEKAWYAVLDTLLAMPSFREDVGGWLLAMFTLLLAGKVWGWIGEGRVDVLEQQPPANPRLFHMRLATSLFVSVAFDLWMLDYCVETVMADPRPGMMVIFTFEFAILTIFSSFTLARYFLTLIQTRVEKKQMQRAIDDRKAEIRAERAAARQNDTATGEPAPASPPSEEPIEVDENELDVPGWEEKRRYLFALEVFTDFIKLLIYIVFFAVSITFNGLPMHIMRDVYMTFASFSKRVADYVAYRKATSDMNARYPDATTEEIRGDACIVCREVMVAWEDSTQEQQPPGHAAPPPPAAAPARRRDEGLRAKKLPCGHILHLRCLKSWLERQQVCPTCRRPVVTAPVTARGQAGAGGAGQPGHGQQGRQQAPRQGRARILNFGPLRIGFLNGPGDQIGNIVRQMQNPNQQHPPQRNPQAPGPPLGHDGAQHLGPNHLGLQVPYATNGQPQTHPTDTAAGSTRQTEIHSLEQRLMQDIQALNIEQSQLANLRAMESEAARLRAWHNSTRSGQRTAQPGPIAAHPWGHIHPHWPPMAQHPPEVLHGSGSQVLASGHESLPAGMTLPEGWAVMPLQRSAAQMPHGNVSTSSLSSVPLPHAAAPGTIVAAQPPVPNGEPTQQPVSTTTHTTTGPTDDHGSPLFVPTEPVNVSTSHPLLPSAQINGLQPQPSADPADTQSQASVQPQHTSTDHAIPWNPSNDWSFVDPPNVHPATYGSGEAAAPPSSTAENQHSNGHPPEVSSTTSQSSGAEQSYQGKGKAKAAQVEDAPDEEGS